MQTSGRFPPRLWERAFLKAQAGHSPSVDAIITWGRQTQERKTAERQKWRDERQPWRKSQKQREKNKA
jgi:hypothetical protein